MVNSARRRERAEGADRDADHSCKLSTSGGKPAASGARRQTGRPGGPGRGPVRHHPGSATTRGAAAPRPRCVGRDPARAAQVHVARGLRRAIRRRATGSRHRRRLREKPRSCGGKDQHRSPGRGCFGHGRADEPRLCGRARPLPIADRDLWRARRTYPSAGTSRGYCRGRVRPRQPANGAATRRARDGSAGRRHSADPAHRGRPLQIPEPRQRRGPVYRRDRVQRSRSAGADLRLHAERHSGILYQSRPSNPRSDRR